MSLMNFPVIKTFLYWSDAVHFVVVTSQSHGHDTSLTVDLLQVVLHSWPFKYGSMSM
jgi:hypothetical protein